MIWIDNHCDVLYQIWKRSRKKPSYLPEKKQEKTNLFLLDSSPLDVTLPGLRKNGSILQSFAIFVPSQISRLEKLKVALEQVDIFYEQVAPYVTQVASCEDLMKLRSDQPGAILTLEGGEALQGDLTNLRLFYRLGVRQLGLTWNDANELADGSWEPRGGGLTRFGKACVEEMVRMQMIIDVSHLSVQGFWDVLAIPHRRVMASHSNCWSLCHHPRNLTDDQIKALIAHDSLIGITYVPHFVHKPYTDAKIDHLIAHIEHICKLGGENYISFGSDFDGMVEKMHELENIGDIPAFYTRLQQHFSKELVKKWTFQNAFRFYKDSLV